MISTDHKSALLAFVNTNRKGHLLLVAASAANLTRVSWVNSFKPTPSVFSFGFGDLEKLTPGYIANCFRKTVVLDHPANVQILDGDPVKFLNQFRRFFVVKMLARSPDSQMSERDFLTGFLAICATLFLSRQVALLARELIFRRLEIARVINLLARAESGETGDSNIHADSLSGCGQGLRFRKIAHQQRIPTVSSARDPELLDLAFKRAAYPDAATTDARNREFVTLQWAGALLLNLLREGMIPVTRFEPGKARFLAVLQSPKERVERKVQSLKSVTLNRAQDVSDFGQFIPRFSQLVRLLVKADCLTAGFVNANSLFQRAVIDEPRSVKRTLTARDKLLVRADAILEGLCDNLGISHLRAMSFSSCQLVRFSGLRFPDS